MKKLYEITLNECVAENVMVYLSERCEHDTPLVDKIAEHVHIIPCDCDSITVKVTADEMAEVLNAIIVLENLA